MNGSYEREAISRRYPNSEKSIQSHPSPEFLNSLSFIKKFYPTPRWGEGKLIKVTYDNSCNSRHSEVRQNRKNPADYNLIQLQGISINSTETDQASMPLGIFASKSVSHYVAKKLAALLPSRLAAKRVAFTLAEILITLGIIGVVAALTIPSVIINYQKKETVTKLKKVYTTLSNAAEMSIAENGDMKGWDWTLAQTDVDKFVETYYVPYLSISEKKWPNENYRIYNLAGRLMISNYSQLVSVILSNGQIIIFKVAHDTGYMWIFADINGTKGPNRVGKDVFVFDGRNFAQRDSNKYYIKFWGQSDLWGRASLIGDNITENTPNTGGYGCSKENKYGYYSGFYCGALIMLDGWKISDDYPW